MILPQFRQFGAVENSGWIDALHVHFLRCEDNVGFVANSKAAIAAVKSETLVVVVVVGPLCGVEVPDCDCGCECPA